MSKVIKLPSGNTVTIKDGADLTLKDRKYVLNNLSETDFDNIGNLLNVLERVAVVIITDWSFDLIPPNVKPETLEELKLADMDAILAEAKEMLPSLVPNLDKSGESNPKAVTPNSAD